MSRLILTSGGVRATVRPRFESRPYRPAPARREHIHGRIQPFEEPKLVTWGRSLPTTLVCLVLTVVTGVVFALPFARSAF